MDVKEITSEIKHLLNKLFSDELKEEINKNPLLTVEIEEMFSVFTGMSNSWIETKKYVECYRWNVVMISNDKKQIYYVKLKDGNLKSIGPIKSINISTHMIELFDGSLYSVTNLCAEPCKGMTIGVDKIANFFGIEPNKISFIADRLFQQMSK